MFDDFENAYEAKNTFWGIWQRNKIRGLNQFDIEQFDLVVRYFSIHFDEFDVFGKFQGFVAKILTRNEVKQSLKGYCYLATIKDEEFAHRCCANENLWNAAA